MLVLSRKNNQAVVVGVTNLFDHILKVTVLEIRGERVRLGFEASKDVSVQRWEVWEKFHAVSPPEGLVEAPVALLA